MPQRKKRSRRPTNQKAFYDFGCHLKFLEHKLDYLFETLRGGSRWQQRLKDEAEPFTEEGKRRFFEEWSWKLRSSADRGTEEESPSSSERETTGSSPRSST